MTKLYIVRHAEAEGNLYRRCHGHYDSGITPGGRLQIDALRKYSTRLLVDALYTSDLRRTMETASAFAHKGLTPHPMPELREIRLGIWEDMPWGRIVYEYPEEYRAFTAGYGFRLEGAETCEHVRTRMLSAIREIVRRHPGQTVAVVSHGMAIRLLMAEITGLPPERTAEVPHPDNASISEIRWDLSPSVVKLGLNDYLGELSTFKKQSWWRGGTGNTDANLRFLPADPDADGDLITEMKLAAWKTVYGTDEGFDPKGMLADARQHAGMDPRAVQFAMLGDTHAGLLHIAPDAGCKPDEYHISLFYLKEEYCGRGLGAQMLGEAISTARAQEKRALRLRVWEKNQRARAFYQKHGFIEQRTEHGMFGRLYVMRKEI